MREQLSGGGDDRRLCAFSVFFEVLSISLEFRIAAAGDEGGEIEGAPDIGPAAPYPALAGALARV